MKNLTRVKIIPITINDKTEYYLASLEKENIDKNDLCAFEIQQDDNTTSFVVGYPDEILSPRVKEIYRILSTPSMLGFYRIEDGPLRIISIMEIDNILKNNGSIRMETMDEFTHPDEYNDVGWGDGLIKPLLKDGKVVLHIDAV